MKLEIFRLRIVDGGANREENKYFKGRISILDEICRNEIQQD